MDWREKSRAEVWNELRAMERAGHGTINQGAFFPFVEDDDPLYLGMKADAPAQEDEEE